MATVQQEIVAGPGKFDLMVALFDNSPRLVKFTLKDGREFKFCVNSVAREDGSGESWIIDGYNPEIYQKSARGCHGYYSTRTRTGWMKYHDS